MRKTVGTMLVGAGLVVAAPLFGAQHAEAAAFTVNFCPGDATCPGNVTEASLTFDEVLTGSDPNDYELTVRISGTAGDPTYIDAVQWKIDGTDASDYTDASLISAPLDGSPWVTYWSLVSNSPAACTSDGTGATGRCSNSTGIGALVDGTNEWIYSVNLVDSWGALSVDTSVNLRAEFDRLNGMNGGILSPGGGKLTTTDVTTTTGVKTTDIVTEPASLVLVGLGLLGVGVRRIRKS